MHITVNERAFLEYIKSDRPNSIFGATRMSHFKASGKNTFRSLERKGLVTIDEGIVLITDDGLAAIGATRPKGEVTLVTSKPTPADEGIAAAREDNALADLIEIRDRTKAKIKDLLRQGEVDGIEKFHQQLADVTKRIAATQGEYGLEDAHNELNSEYELADLHVALDDVNEALSDYLSNNEERIDLSEVNRLQERQAELTDKINHFPAFEDEPVTEEPSELDWLRVQFAWDGYQSQWLYNNPNTPYVRSTVISKNGKWFILRPNTRSQIYIGYSAEDAIRSINQSRASLGIRATQVDSTNRLIANTNHFPVIENPFNRKKD